MGGFRKPPRSATKFYFGIKSLPGIKKWSLSSKIIKCVDLRKPWYTIPYQRLLQLWHEKMEKRLLKEICRTPSMEIHVHYFVYPSRNIFSWQMFKSRQICSFMSTPMIYRYHNALYVSAAFKTYPIPDMHERYINAHFDIMSKWFCRLLSVYLIHCVCMRHFLTIEIYVIF